MAIVGLVLDKNEVSCNYIKETSEKLSSPNILDSPFRGFIKEIESKDDYFILSDLTPYIQPWIFLMGAVFLASLLSGFKPSLWFLITVPFIFATFVCSRFGLFLSFYFGLKKKGYKGRIKLLNSNEIIRRLL
jgi:hypothetical protein